MASEELPRHLLIAVSNTLVDGEDFGWLWDVDFEAMVPRLRAVTVSGLRADELANRLKYAGLDPVKMTVVEDRVPALDAALAAPRRRAADHRGRLHPDHRAPRGDAPPGLGWAILGGLMDYPTLRIAHLYPSLLNVAGDGGNVMALVQRCAWRGIPTEVVEVEQGDTPDFTTFDLILFHGGRTWRWTWSPATSGSRSRPSSRRPTRASSSSRCAPGCSCWASVHPVGG